MSSGLLASGFSDVARFVDEASQGSRRALHKSNVFGLESRVREELAAVGDECCHEGWDGYGALPIVQDTLRNAHTFLESLPYGFPAPSIGAEPDGQLTMEWHRATRRTLSVSVTPDGELHYAAILGPNRVYGTEAFFGNVPKSIQELIGRVYSQ